MRAVFFAIILASSTLLTSAAPHPHLQSLNALVSRSQPVDHHAEMLRHQGLAAHHRDQAWEHAQHAATHLATSNHLLDSGDVHGAGRHSDLATHHRQQSQYHGAKALEHDGHALRHAQRLGLATRSLDELD
ncbi:hypothetical protein PIIN_09899 [Serendipita indica DSM 11827]|uniref:Uncharacterized protein n=1 Tax=Serendipita indica (strain DSM 11827) TaxID=1109443 RepID=G4TX60_SERID|nr:hypothetical protein PIIN_09899 [Serendipita indica DSM 11827]